MPLEKPFLQPQCLLRSCPHALHSQVLKVPRAKHLSDGIAESALQLRVRRRTAALILRLRIF